MDKQSSRSDRPCSRIELVTAMVGIMTMGNVPSWAFATSGTISCRGAGASRRVCLDREGAHAGPDPAYAEGLGHEAHAL